LAPGARIRAKRDDTWSKNSFTQPGDVENMKITCDVCGKRAIGIQILGCCCSTVCEEHAEQQLRELKPGEKKEWGVCYFVRFPTNPEKE
jgi:hypothetical protein